MLFYNITGLSYRKGEESQEDYHFLPFVLPTLPCSDILDDCNMYYYKCVARAAALNSAISSPSKVL